MAFVGFNTIRFDIFILNTSAVSGSINLASILVFASGVIGRPLVFTDALSFEYKCFLWMFSG